ncbi:protein SWEETIE, partial [Carica papaya]|uniref:protein SWEETIE n=1 Tax=Carica papaya TaxID=3649 RepID=UPI000B8D03BD
MARNYVRENVPLSRFGVLVAQLESIVASASQQSPDPLLCFDLLSDLISAIDEEPKESILLWQRKCEDALYSLITLGARRPIRHLASLAMARIISKGDSISIYSRVSSLQGFLSDGKRSDPQRVAENNQCAPINRLPRMVLEVSKKMLTEPSRNLVAALVEQEAGWLLLSSLLSSMLKEELEDQVFDILGLWADVFTGNPEHVIKQCKDLISTICVWSAAVHALTEFVRRFVSSDVVNNGILLQPVIVYLNRALSYVSVIAAKQPPNIKSAVDIFIIRILIAYQSLPDPMAYKSDHPQIIQLCTTPYRDASGCEESSCLRLLLDKRDVWLGPWTPGRDWFEDELRAFQGGKDGLMPCVWENELSSFPLPETVNKTLVNQMLLCFGVMFASQDNGEMLSLLGVIEHCLKAGKKQLWHPASMTNICVGLLAGLKALLALRRQPLGIELLNSAQAIFQGILAEGDICASQRRASSEGLGLLARLGSDIFTARMSRLLLADLNGITDSSYAGSITFALGCIHRSAGGMALSSLVPATVNSISLLAKTSIAGLQIWSLHGLLLTVESAGLSFVSHVQATLGLAMDILLSEESGWVDLQQGVGRLIGNLVRTTIRRLLYASCPSYPSRWRLICRNMILATSSRRTEGDNITENDSLNGTEGDTRFHYGEDDDNMVSSSRGTKIHVYRDKNKHLRYRTKVFAAECLSLLPEAVGTNPAHFDLSLAREKPVDKQNSGDWLVLRLQELISLAYEISTIQFANMRPIGVGLLSTIIDKFETIPDPELPGHLLLEQYQAQLLSAVRTALDTSSGPVLLEAGLQLATKIMTSGMISGDQNAVKRIFSLISRPLTDFKDLYYPSFAEWVSCKIKIRLLAAHASLKCYTYAFLRRHHVEVPDEYQALLPLFSESSSKLGEYWVRLLKDYSYICLCLTLKRNWTPLLDGIQSPMVSAKLQPCLEEAWPVILQALALDAVPARVGEDGLSTSGLISGYSMVKLDSREYQFLWGFAMLVLFQDNHPARSKQIIPLGETKAKSGADSEESGPPSLKLYEIVLPVFQFFCAQSFFSVGFLTISICQELLQVLSYSVYMENSWDSLAISILAQIVRNCPEDFLETEEFTYLAMELCFGFLFKIFQSSEASFTDDTNWEDLISPLLLTAKSLMKNFKLKMQFKSVPLALLLIGYKGIRQASTESCLSKVIDFAKGANDIVRKLFYDTPEIASDAKLYLRTIFGTWLDVIVDLTENCIEDLHLFETKRDNSSKVSLLKLAFCIEQNVSLAKLAHELECQGYDKEYSPLHFSVFKYCSKCIQAVLTHSNIQVQATGLQVLKSMVQRGTNFEDNFLIFFVGELLGDVFTIIKRILKKPITRASATTACECLGVLMLLQTQSKAIEAQKGFMNLFLEAILMVFSISEDGSSKEVNDIKSTVVRLVSHLVQIPSSAVQFKDVLLSMPVPQRQLLQGFIRSSVTQDKDAIQMKPMNPPLDIKLPAPTEVRVERNSVTSSTPRERDVPPSTISNDFNTASTQESEEDEDDWDTFQSFPASTSTSNLQVESVAEEPGLVENTSNSELSALSEDSQEQPHFQPLSVVQTSSAEHLEACEGLIVSNSDQVEQNDFRTEIAEPSEVQNQDSEEKTISGLEQKEEAASIHLEDAEGSPKELGTEDPEPKRDSPDYNHGVSSSDAEGLIEISKVEDEYGIQSPNDKLDLQELPDSLPADGLSCNEIPERKTDGQSKERQV